YDTALSTSDYVQAALREFVPRSQVLFGSDWPLVPEKVVKIETAGLEGSRVLDDAARSAIYRDNALALFPRFARKATPAAASWNRIAQHSCCAIRPAAVESPDGRTHHAIRRSIR